MAKLIEYNKLSLLKVLPKDKISKILPNIHGEKDTLTAIKTRLNGSSISFGEISCVLAGVKNKNKLGQCNRGKRWRFSPESQLVKQIG